MAVLRALDDALGDAAREAETPLPAPAAVPLAGGERERLAATLAALRQEMAGLERARGEETAQAREWVRRARIAWEEGRLDLTTHAERRRREHEAHAAELGDEMARMRETLERGEARLAAGIA